MLKVATDWTDYEIIASGDGMKLERWGEHTLLRPDPQAIWKAPYELASSKNLSAYYNRSSSGGGGWEYYKKIPDSFNIKRKQLTFSLKLMGFKHTGLFPEQAVNWDIMHRMIKDADRPLKILNLFAYTGGATLACLSAGAEVCHVDAARAMVERAKDNIKLSQLNENNIRYIVDDCFKFVSREIKRGKRYDGIIMDPPSYGRGPNGEIWKIENDLSDFVSLTFNLMSDNPLFVLINSYTTGLQPTVLSNLLKVSAASCGIKGADIQSYELGLSTQDRGIILPSGASGLISKF